MSLKITPGTCPYLRPLRNLAHFVSGIFTKIGAIPAASGPCNIAPVPLTEGCSMEAYQVVRAGLQLNRGDATAVAGLPAAAQGEIPGAQ